MKLEPFQTPHNPIKDLSPLDKNCYYVAVTVAFVSIFAWAIKILFL
jgi:hypothetical protein